MILAGDGPSFSAGADVEWMRSSVDLSYEENVEDALRLRRMFDAIDACPAPVIARVQGYALGYPMPAADVPSWLDRVGREGLASTSGS